jgi:hypothetical protein
MANVTGLATTSRNQKSRQVMQDYLASLERLRRDAEEVAILRDRATDPDKLALYHRLHQHYLSLAAEVQKAIKSVGTWGPKKGSVLMKEPLPAIIENSLQIAWDFLDASGEIEDPQQTAEVLLGAIKTLVLRGEHRRLMLSNRAIDAFREFKQAAWSTDFALTATDLVGCVRTTQRLRGLTKETAVSVGQECPANVRLT